MATHYEPSVKLPHGLDREPMHAYSALDNHNDEQDNPVASESGRSGVRRKLRHVSQRIASKFHDSDKPPPPLDRHIEPTAPVLAPPPTQDTHNIRLSEEVDDKRQLPAFNEFLHAPLDTLKSVAQKQGGKEFADAVANTDATHGASVKLVLAHEKVEAKTAGSQQQADAAQEFADLKKVRQDAFVRWTFARHVRRMEAVPPEPPLQHRRQDFIWSDQEGGEARMHWADYGEHLLTVYTTKHAQNYIGASSKLPEPTAEALSTSVERVLLTSVPLQNMVMKIMSVAFWESPTETATYALLYFTLCVFNYVTRAIILFTLFSVLKAKYYPPTIPELRKKLERSEDVSQTAQDLSELIEQHGTRGWVDALMARAGPTMQLLLEDAADFMEIAKNFSEWRDPLRTRNTLIFLFICWAGITFTPVWLLVKASMMSIGVVIFAIIPISHHWPQYRLLVNPLTWLFWKVPTHGQWAIARLQAEAKAQLENLFHEPRKDSANDGLPLIGPMPEPRNTDIPNSEGKRGERPNISIGRYRGVCSNRDGTLCLNLNELYFEAQLTGKSLWKLRYENMRSLRKVANPGSNNPLSHTSDAADEGIQFVDTDDQEYQVSALKERDEVYTQIIGYSGVEWQITG